MAAHERVTAKEKLLVAGTDLFRRNGIDATGVDELCAAAGVTKGAFFHHFSSKEAFAEACLQGWDAMVAEMEQAAAFQKLGHPLERAIAYLDFYIDLMSDARPLKSCLAGTAVQEASESYPKIRRAANACFVNGAARCAALLEAAVPSGRAVDAGALAALWMATIQGSLILYKASGDAGVIRTNLTHVKQYIVSQITG